MPIVLQKRIRTERAGGGGNDCDKVTQGGGNSKKLKKITRKVKGKAPKEICWREMTKHQIGKKNGEKNSFSLYHAGVSVIKRSRSHVYQSILVHDFTCSENANFTPDKT